MARHKSFASVSKKFEKYAKDIPRLTQKQLKAVAFFAFQRIVEISPVDTGMYRQSHIISFNTPNIGVALDGNNYRSTEYGRSFLNSGYGNAIYISTSLPYSLPLENGWSPQAPNGIYSEVLDEIPTYAKKVKFKLG